jgi:hypothetical protein
MKGNASNWQWPETWSVPLEHRCVMLPITEVLGMNEMPVPQPKQVAAAPPAPKTADPLRRWTLAILAVFILLFGWTLVADRLTPYTSDASVRVFVVRMVPEVSGKIVEVAVSDNQIVRTGVRAGAIIPHGCIGEGHRGDEYRQRCDDDQGEQECPSPDRPVDKPSLLQPAVQPYVVSQLRRGRAVPCLPIPNCGPIHKRRRCRSLAA